MEKALVILAKAVTAAAAVAVLLAVLVMIDSRTLFALPLAILGLVAGTYSWRVVSRRTEDTVAAPVLRQRIQVS